MQMRRFLLAVLVGVCAAENCGDLINGCGEGFACISEVCVPLPQGSGGGSSGSGSGSSGSGSSGSGSASSGSGSSSSDSGAVLPQPGTSTGSSGSGSSSDSSGSFDSDSEFDSDSGSGFGAEGSSTEGDSSNTALYAGLGVAGGVVGVAAVGAVVFAIVKAKSVKLAMAGDEVLINH